MNQKAARINLQTPPGSPVDRRVLVATETVQIRDNRCARTDPAISTPTDPLSYFEVVLPLAGLWVRTVRGHDYAVEPNTVHFFSEGEVYRVHHPAGCGDRNTGVSVVPEVLDEIASLDEAGVFDRRRRMFRISCRQASDAEISANILLRRALHDSNTEPLAVEETALRLVAATITTARTPPRSLNRPSTERAHRDLLARVIHILHRRLAQSLTLAQIAREAATSPFHMARVFRKQSGMSVHGYLMRLRIAAAADRLLDTDLPLTAIAEQVGLADAPHLCRTLRRVLDTNANSLRTLKWRDALAKADQRLLSASS